MWDTWLSGSALPALEQSAAFAQKRHTVLAGNIANLGVPGYKTRDISVDEFQSALKEAIETKDAPKTDRYGNPTMIPDAAEKVRDVSKQILYHDGTDMSLEMQVTEISKNQAMHDMSISLMRSQFNTLKAAIQESPSA